MKHILLAILLYPFIVKSQGATVDSAGNISGNIIGYTKTVNLDTAKANLYSWTSSINASKQNGLVSGTNIKTVNGNTLLGSGDIAISAGFVWGNATGTLSNQTDLQNALNAKLATNGSVASLTNFPTLNQNTTGTSSNVTGVVAFANGGISASAATSATTGTITVNMTSSVITCTPTGAMTLNASGGVAGQIITFSFTTSGTTSFTITFGTNFRKVGTLATGTTSARFFTVTFRCLDGTVWSEISRTAAQT